MAVTITRETGLIGLFGAVAVRVDGEIVAKVADNETVRIELAGDEATLRVTQYGSRSNKLQVRDGDALVIRIPMGYKILYFAMAFLPLVTALFFDRSFELATIVVLSMGALLLFLETFRITKK